MVDIDRINFLAKKSREEGLTDAEKTEQAQLRKEYIAAVKRNFTAQLDSIIVVDEQGKPVEKQLDSVVVVDEDPNKPTLKS